MVKSFDRNPEYTKMVDKFEVKKYVNIIGENILFNLRDMGDLQWH